MSIAFSATLVRQDVKESVHLMLYECSYHECEYDVGSFIASANYSHL